MNKGDKIELQIEKGIFGGEGLSFYNQQAIFVPEGVPGDVVEVEIISAKKDYARGLITKIVQPSEIRVAPDCKCFAECGGCDYMMISYEEQLKLKKRILEETIRKIGKIKECNIKEMMGMESPYYYRNKIIQPFGENNGKCISGFYKRRTHEIVDNNLCIIQSEISNKILKKIKEIINTSGISIYNERQHNGLLRNVMIRTNSAEEVMLVLILNGKSNEKVNNIVNEIIKVFNNIKSVYLSINTRETNVVLGEKLIHIFGEKHIVENIDGINFFINPLSFFQVNTLQMKKLYDKAVEYVEQTKCKIVIDAYSGTGTIASILSKKTEKVIAIEIVKEAVESAKYAAKINGIDNITFIEGAVEQEIANFTDSDEKIETIVFDPPRKGLEKIIIDKVCDAKIKDIIYISCNPATFARDCALFYERGYEIEEITPVDMFPHTHHIEIVSKISRRII